MAAVNILVSGDFVLDHHIYEGRRHHYGDLRNRGVLEKEELGGAALVYYLLQALDETKDENGVVSARGEVVTDLSVKLAPNRAPDLAPGQAVPSAFSAYAIWRPLDVDQDAAPERQVWLTTDAMGFGHVPAPGGAFSWPRAQQPAQPDVVVLSEGGMGFRSDSSAWPSDAVLQAARWVVLKTAGPLAAGSLWERLMQEDCRHRLVVVVSAAELRRSTALISAGLSWDATVESVLAALAPGAELSALAGCRHLVVAFGTEGGLWLDLHGGNVPLPEAWAHLVYDATAVEGEHRRPDRGTAFGALSCLTASLAWRLALRPAEPDLETALEGGLAAMRDLLVNGHGPGAVKGDGFPASRLAGIIRRASCSYARMAFSAGAVTAGSAAVAGSHGRPSPGTVCWGLMHESLRQQGEVFPEPAWRLAELFVRHGPIALGSLPHLCIGGLLSVDRREIEALRVLRRLILDYKARPSAACRKPLSIGVFGPPGSGKSFAVREITKSLIGKDEWMEFNLSQFKQGTEDLIGAFHQVRDRRLRNQVPVAFFDEFDARGYEWLQYLLAPMQDGAFQEGQVTHPIGKCILIFAGGTSWTFDSFGPPEGDVEAYTRFRMAKGPDFKSRLDGFLDVLGPNRRATVIAAKDAKSYDRIPDPCDVFFPVRRAFVARSELGCGAAGKLEIEAGLLRALLRAESYTHGSRSLSKVLDPLRAARPGPVHRSDLLPPQQLALHANAVEFMEECRRLPPSPTPTGVAHPGWVAEAIHETWRQLGIEQGWTTRGDPGRDVGFPELSDFYRDSNLAAAGRMASNLALVGLRLEPGPVAAPTPETIRLRLEHYLELLAEAEHAGWMDWHLDRGWVYGPARKECPLTDEPRPDQRVHPCLRPYAQLSDAERHKDRETVRHYPDFAAKAGMRIAPL